MQGHLFYLKQTEGYDADITIKRKNIQPHLLSP